MMIDQDAEQVNVFSFPHSEHCQGFTLFTINDRTDSWLKMPPLGNTFSIDERLKFKSQFGTFQFHHPPSKVWSFFEAEHTFLGKLWDVIEAKNIDITRRISKSMLRLKEARDLRGRV